ncbi:MAG: hypothetical protein H6625_08880 [Bdellovibrionaceae bacterium]|nr:hypothetical protein [Pseudobdellovibrionaceae bacterium]
MTRTLDFYNKIEHWILDQYKESNKECFFVGINAPQGAGKTTLCNHLVKNFKNRGLPSLAISIDDFYLTHENQLKLAKKYPENPYLQQRGYPGTHDLTLGTEILKKIKNLKDGSIIIPRYNKSAFMGKGDRYPEENWELIQGPIKIVLLEGWLLGFLPPSISTSASELSDHVHWQILDNFLENYHSWFKELNSFIYLKAQDSNFVLSWRLEAEQNMRSQGKSGMSDSEVMEYAKLFLPAYKRYSDSLHSKDFKIPFLEFTINRERQAID